MAFLGLKLGLDLEMRAAHTHQKFQRVPPPPLPPGFKSTLQITKPHFIRCHKLGFKMIYSVQVCQNP